MIPDVVSPADYPALQALSEQAEQRPEFKAAPHGEAPYAVNG